MASSSDAVPVKKQQTKYRDNLRTIERNCHLRWAEERIFEVNAPSPEETAQLSVAQILEKYPKWFGTFPYPYMNGLLHLGHAFTISKIEFAAGYQRMLGKRVLYPHGFHCTGMPIKVASDKIIREMDMFGPEFQNYTPEDVDDESPVHLKKAYTPEKFVHKAKKGKLVAKSTGLKYQFQILESIGIPRDEIKKFSDPLHWLKFFPSLTRADHNAFGSRIDWRRSFITTDANPYYDSFVRWQINKLRALDKIRFGKRYTVYSPKDGQPCMDHDRQEGENLGPHECTGLKMEVVQWPEELKDLVKSKLAGKKVFLVAATLRPETMYGQTNCFVGTSIKYGVFAAKNNEVYICTNRAARNMAFQDILEKEGEVTQLLEIDGAKLVGAKIKAPFGIVPEVYVLPMEGVKSNEGTGVVTSVPSDSPDDFGTLSDLKKKPEFYKIKPEWCAIDPIPVISTRTYGDLIAPELVKKIKIDSSKDVKLLAEAKVTTYKNGSAGSMLVGTYKGMKAEKARDLVRKEMIDAGLAFAYAEPEGLILSRSNDECVIAYMDQYYLDYGEPTWKAQAEKFLALMNTYSEGTRNALEGAISRLKEWAFARTYGLGTKLPWDDAFTVESLSDSTIYMSYYTVAHLLQGGVIDGSQKGPLGVSPEQLTDEVWEYVFCDGPWPASGTTLERPKADAMKREFNYFYPMDIRSSGKDLVNNHFAFSIYNHAAIFSEEKWPLSMRANGHLMLNGKKMSKSTGNSLTLRESLEKFGADATRLSLADASDEVDDANFDEKNAEAAILRVHALITWCEDIKKSRRKLRTGPKSSYHDRVFEEEINALILQTKENYEAMRFKDALKNGFFEMQNARDRYRDITSDIGMHVDLVKYWIRISCLLVTPIAPHFSEHIWSTVLGEPKSIQLASFPEPTRPVDQAVLDSAVYMRNVLKKARSTVATMSKQAGKNKVTSFDPKKPKSLRIYVSNSIPEWQEQCVQIIKESYDQERDKVDDFKIRALLKDRGWNEDKRAVPFVQEFKKRIAQFGAQAAFKRTLPFSETDVLQELIPYIKKNMTLVDVDVWAVADAPKQTDSSFSKVLIEQAEPGSPSIQFRNV